MKLSLKWLKEYVELPKDLEVSKLIFDLTMSTVEVEGVTELASKFDKMIVGVIKEVLPHPNADKLKLCKTDIGGNIKEIVCGGSNLEEGMKVAVALPGAMVRWHGEGELVELGIAKVRDVESYGMICASSEIGLFDLFPFEDEDEIVDLSSFDAKAGTPLAEALGIDDTILEIDNKSLTNRPDLWGHYGIAREISALYNLPLKEFVPFETSIKSELVNIDNPSLCPRYIGVKIEGLSVEPSPFEVQKLLWSVGVHPINAIVDITNYVMLATGQPTHAFDSDNIKDKIIVRNAKKDEKLLLLNGNELTLSESDLVIADIEGPVGLAGVMGGEKDSVLDNTNKVILEVANFEPIGIRKTATRYEVRTESAIRYEKGIDPERCDIALSMAMKMLEEIYPNMTITGYQDNYLEKLKRSEIQVSLDWLEKRLGKRIPNEEITSILKRLGFEVDINGDIMHVTSPTWRSTGDVSIPDDILEEIARIHGFENFEATPIETAFNGAINQLDIDLDRKVREYLAFRCGMQEIFTYPWVNEEYLKAILVSTNGMLSLATPPSPDERFIRSSLIPNLCRAVSENLRFFNEFAIFESTQVFFDSDFSTKYDPKESLPSWKRNVAGAYVCDPKDLDSLFRKVKGVIEALPRYVHTETITFEKKEKPIWADDVVWLNICHDGKAIGNLALLAKKVSLECGIKNNITIIFELDIDSLKPYPSRTNKFVELPEYPMTEYDLSLLVDGGIKWEKILEIITEISDDLLQDVYFVDEYKGEQVPDGKKSITLRLLIGSLEKTLTSEEIDNYANQVFERLNKKFGAELRS